MSRLARPQGLLLAMMALLAVGCQVWFEPLPKETQPLATALTPPRPLRLAVCWAAVPLARDLRAAYEARGHDEGLEIIPMFSEKAYEYWQNGQADVAIIARPMDQIPERTWRPIAQDALMFVVNAALPLYQISSKDLAALYSGYIVDWSALGVGSGMPEFIVQPEGTVARQIFDEAIMRGKELSTAALILPHDEAVQTYVAQHPLAIGYLSAAYKEVEDGVHVVALDGLLPTQREAYPLQYRLYIAAAPKNAAAQAFVAFALSRAGRAVVAGRYALPD